MALFRNLGVKLRVPLCGPAESGIRLASRLGGIFLTLLIPPAAGLNWKPTVPTLGLMDGH